MAVLRRRPRRRGGNKSGVMDAAAGLRDAQREKIREQAGLIRWQNDRLNQLEVERDRLKDRLQDYFVQNRELREIATRAQQKAKERLRELNRLKQAAWHAGVWDAVLAELEKGETDE